MGEEIGLDDDGQNERLFWDLGHSYRLPILNSLVDGHARDSIDSRGWQEVVRQVVKYQFHSKNLKNQKQLLTDGTAGMGFYP